MPSESRLRLTALAVAVAVAGTSACSASVEGTAVAAPELTATSSAPPPVEVPDGFDETADVELQPGKPGGTFRVADYEPATVDPAEAVTGSDILVTSNVFTPLTLVGPDLKVGPGAAESWESDSKCTKWTFKLKAGGTFHNGEPVTAQSFVDGFERGAKGAGAGYQMEGIKGYPKVGKGVQAVDDQTLTVALSKPDCEFPVRAAHPVFAPSPKERGPKTKPIGNGPFKITDHATGQNLTLARFDEYSIGDKPYLDEVQIVVVSAPMQATSGFKASSDWVRASGAQLRSLRDQHAPTGNWIAKTTPGYSGLVPMLDGKPLKKADARKAISMAIDREQLAETAFDGSVPPATGLISEPFGDAHQPDACKACEFDPAKAKQLAKKGGLGKKLTLAFQSRPETKMWAEAIAAQLEKNLGITVKLQALPPDEFYEKQRKRGASGLWRGAWLPDVATADDMLRPLLSTPAIKNGTNVGGYSSKAFDKLLDAAARTADDAERAGIFRQAEELAIGTDMALIPLFGRKEFRLADNEKFMNLRMDFYENPDLRVAFSR